MCSYEWFVYFLNFYDLLENWLLHPHYFLYNADGTLLYMLETQFDPKIFYEDTNLPFMKPCYVWFKKVALHNHLVGVGDVQLASFVMQQPFISECLSI